MIRNNKHVAPAEHLTPQQLQQQQQQLDNANNPNNQNPQQQSLLNIGFVLRNQWRIEAKLGQGAFGQIYAARDLVTQQDVAIKIEKIDPKNRNKMVLRLEVMAMKKLQACPYVVRYIHSGRYEYINYLVMEKLGENLADLRKKIVNNGAFSMCTTLKLGIQMIKAIEGVHKLGFIHRDIKPSNFVLGIPLEGMKRSSSNLVAPSPQKPQNNNKVSPTNSAKSKEISEKNYKNYRNSLESSNLEKNKHHHHHHSISSSVASSSQSSQNYGENAQANSAEQEMKSEEEWKKHRIFLIDFGLARKFLLSTGELKPPRKVVGFRGTARYASLASHLGKDLGRKDDIWSIFFILVEFFKGALPWRALRDRQKIGEIKEQYLTPQGEMELLKGCPLEMKKFKDHLAKLSFFDEPDYDYLCNLLIDVFSREGFSPDAPFDWENPRDTTTMGDVSTYDEPAMSDENKNKNKNNKKPEKHGDNPKHNNAPDNPNNPNNHNNNPNNNKKVEKNEEKNGENDENGFHKKKRSGAHEIDFEDERRNEENEIPQKVRKSNFCGMNCLLQ